MTAVTASLDELVREMRVFAAQGFSGVEIQAIGADVSDSDWDSPAFYANVRAVLDAAGELDMRVDLTAGWWKMVAVRTR